jgi:hypothetical protein
MADTHPFWPAGAPSSASYSVSPDDYRVPFQKRRLIAIPEGLFQFYNSPFFLRRRTRCLLSYSYGCRFTYGAPLGN